MADSPYPRMTEAEAAAWVAVACQATSEPCLSAEELQHLTRNARRADEAGRAPGSTSWVPTWDLAWAAWQGWTMKAAKAALMVDVSADGSSVSKSQVREACLVMAQQFARGVQQAVHVTTQAATTATGAIGPATAGTTFGLAGELLPDEADLNDEITRRDGLPVP